ncbi:hypothetical protein AB0G85_29605 [Streptomyces sioyaensis]|uniref:hypothetical protein n=1 Tax=Streptomyces sioyaensis TaxID=67364 RepID=UPI00340BF723
MLAAVLVLVAALTGVGQQATAAGSGPRDDTQDYFYVPLHGPGNGAHDTHVLSLYFAYDGRPRDAELTVDASGIDGVAVIKGGADGCKPRMPNFTCSMPLHPDSEGLNSQELAFLPAAGARAGDSGTLRYTLKPEGLPAVRDSLTVIAGQPELRVNKIPAPKGMAVGERFSVPILIRNTGDVPTRDVELSIDGNEGLSAVTRHSNCRYSTDASTIKCLLPDTVIAPGETMRVTPALRLKTDRDAPVTASLDYGASDAPLSVDKPDPDLTPGHAAPLSLTRDPARGKGTTFATDQEGVRAMVPVRNTADIEAFGFSPSLLDVGSSHRIRIGYRNNGPADVAEVRTVFTVPPGTKVTQAPYDPEREEEMIDQPCQTKDNGRSYTCTGGAAVGHKVFYDFTLRITSEDTRPGSVAVSGWTEEGSTTRVKDTKRSNDTAPVQPDDGVSVWAIGAGIAAVVALLVVIHRRRKASRSGPAKPPWLMRFERDPRPPIGR